MKTPKNTSKAFPISVTVGDGFAIQSVSHGWKRGSPMLDGMCFNCGFDEKTCDCEVPDVQNPLPKKDL